jgi:hypothetical protein
MIEGCPRHNLTVFGCEDDCRIKADPIGTTAMIQCVAGDNGAAMYPTPEQIIQVATVLTGTQAWKKHLAESAQPAEPVMAVEGLD